MRRAVASRDPLARLRHDVDQIRLAALDDVDAAANRGVMIVLAYLWPLAIVPLLLEKNDADLQWHA